MIDSGHDDAQRTLEQRALQNVRGLVEKMEAEDRAQSAVDRAFIPAVLAIVAGIVGLLATAIFATAMWRNFFSTATAPDEPRTRTVYTSPSPPSELEAKIAEEIRNLQSRPRKEFVGARPLRFADYVGRYVEKVEATAKSDYQAAIRGLSVKLQLTTGIASDGRVESIEISRSSGIPAVDQAAIQIVRKAAPFGPFPADMKKDVDILYVTRNFEFIAGKPAGRGAVPK
jgi:TonB family protein